LSEAENDGAGKIEASTEPHRCMCLTVSAVDAALLLLSKLNLGGGQMAPLVEVQPGRHDGIGLGMGEATRHGVLILPDLCDGWGPL
jgi:hypothetical protein